MNREEFEKFCRELYNTGFYHENSYVLNYHDLIGVKVDAEYMMYKAWQEATTRQQKIIDELKANNFALSAMVCKHPDKRTLDENYDSSKDYCDMLKAENPDVPCPACEGSGDDKDEDFNDALGKCGYCNNGTVSTVKALQYENERLISIAPEMSEEIETLQKLIKNISKAYYKGGDAMHYAISEAKNYMEGGH